MQFKNTNINFDNLIQREVERISTKYNKDFLECEDIMKITGLGRDTVRKLLSHFQQQRSQEDML